MIKTVTYRVNNGPCKRGYQKTDKCADDTVYDTATDQVVIGAVVVSGSDCPQEVVVVGDGGSGTVIMVNGAPVSSANPLPTEDTKLLQAVQALAVDVAEVNMNTALTNTKLDAVIQTLVELQRATIAVPVTVPALQDGTSTMPTVVTMGMLSTSQYSLSVDGYPEPVVVNRSGSDAVIVVSNNSGAAIPITGIVVIARELL